MTQPFQAVLAAIERLVAEHPELVPQVEAIAARARARDSGNRSPCAEQATPQDVSAREVFHRVYAEGHWGRSGDPDQPFFSGRGSHDAAFVEPYVAAVGCFLATAPVKLSALDVGCGDFNVGSRLRPLCAAYTACDVVEALIEHDKVKFRHLDVDFQVLDLVRDQLPRADVIFVRQVLQHLSNAQIARAAAKLAASCRYLVVTEHLPAGDAFEPNLDKPAGADIRLAFRSGVVLTEPPFRLAPASMEVLCEVPAGEGVVRTMLYHFA